ncbi:MAG: HPr family phosphocarrier protein [Clostridia bacterium]|nr:HPr family phosphocarrier protein [Clostridia bacterium]
MKETVVVLSNVQDIRDFVNCVILVDYEVDLVQGRYTVDAKSIMGIFSLDLLSPIKLIAHTDDAEEFFENIARFTAKN